MPNAASLLRPATAALLTGALAAAVAGCGGSSHGSAAPPAPAPTATGSPSTSTPATSPSTGPPSTSRPSTGTAGATLLTTPPPWPLPANSAADIAAAGLTPAPSETLQVHYHAHLDILVDGAPVTVPPGVGFVFNGTQATAVSSLHTHDNTGVIHIEAPADVPFTLGQFFTEWGVVLGPGQIGGLHSDAGHVLLVEVNGQEVAGDPAKVVLRPHEEVALYYGPATPRPNLPSSYSFPAGE